jgi:hypothetical protein
VVKPGAKFFNRIFNSCNHGRLLTRLVLATLLSYFSSLIVTAQDNTLYHMPEITQANQLNPAYYKLCRIYVELPVISSVKLNIRNTGFGFHDVFEPGTGSQSNSYVVNVTKLDRSLSNINYSQFESDINLLGFGFGFKEWYFTFGISNHSDFLTYYPHDVMKVRDDLLQGTGNVGTFVNVQSGMELTVWNSIGISAATEIRDGFKVGVRLKYLQGMTNAISHGSELVYNYVATPASLDAFLASRINTSFPLNVEYAPGGAVRSLNTDNSLNNILGDFIFNGNRGASVDAGFVYDLDEETQISGSITDLGFIHWKKNVNSFSVNKNYTYKDTSLAQFQNSPGRIDLIRAIGDSISKAFINSPSGYYTLVPVKIFAGISHRLMPTLTAAAMTRIEFYDRHVMPSLTLSMNYKPIPPFSFSMSYTVMNNKFNQVGAGIALGNRIAQFYLVTDNIVVRWKKDPQSSYFWPYNARMISIRTGINLLFGCREKEKVKHHKGSEKDICPAYR